MEINRLKDWKGIASRSLRLLVVVMLLTMMMASQANAEYWKQKFSKFAATAGETLATGDVVCIKGSDGLAYKADADSATLRPAVGVIGKGGATNATVEIVVEGILAGQTINTPGQRLYLSAATAGALTSIAPANEQCLGWVLPSETGVTSSGNYYIKVTPPISPGAGY